MKNSRKFILTLPVFFILVGCTPTYNVTLDSHPQGAELICKGRNMGYTPVTLELESKVKQEGSINLRGCSANWVSGAQEYYSYISIAQNPDSASQTVYRVRDEGYAQDAEFALKVQQSRYQKKQMEAAQQAAEAAQQAAEAAQQAADAARRQNN